MKITDLIKSRVLDNARSNRKGEANQTQANENGAPAGETSAALANGQDVITISPLARQFAQFSRILEDDNAERRKRVADLKEKVESGSYDVAASAVAQAVLDYSKE